MSSNEFNWFGQSKGKKVPKDYEIKFNKKFSESVNEAFLMMNLKKPSKDNEKTDN